MYAYFVSIISIKITWLYPFHKRTPEISICHPLICKKAKNNGAVFDASTVCFIGPPVGVFTGLNVIFPRERSLQILVRNPNPKSAFRIIRTFFSTLI